MKNIYCKKYPNLQQPLPVHLYHYKLCVLGLIIVFFQGLTIRNLDAFKVLQETFLQVCHKLTFNTHSAIRVLHTYLTYRLQSLVAICYSRLLDRNKTMVYVFLQTKDENLCLHILHAIRNIFSSDSSNFFALGNLHTLTLFIERAPTKKRDVQMEIFKLVEFVALQLHWVPTQELMAIGILFKHKQ